MHQFMRSFGLIPINLLIYKVKDQISDQHMGILICHSEPRNMRYFAGICKKRCLEVSKDAKTTKTDAVSVASGVKATECPKEAMAAGIPLMLPANAIVETFAFSEVSKGGQLKYVQDRDIPEEVFKLAPYLRGSLKPALFNEYRGNPGIYLSGDTIRAKGLDPEKGTFKKFVMVIIPL